MVLAPLMKPPPKTREEGLVRNVLTIGVAKVPERNQVETQIRKRIVVYVWHHAVHPLAPLAFSPQPFDVNLDLALCQNVPRRTAKHRNAISPSILGVEI